jgi:hypothetical protein
VTVPLSTKQGKTALGIALLAGIFGLLTLKSGGSVLFIDGPDRVAAGNYVPFVLWFNFLAGFAYMAAAAGIFLEQPWAAVLVWLIAILTLLVFIALGVHIFLGGAYEMRTIGAMSLRSIVWIGIALYLNRAGRIRNETS